MDFLYPEIEPFSETYLPVSDLHTVHFEQCGNPHGEPVLFIHGGPGGGIDPLYRRFFHPDHFHVILVNQRGSGKSTPHAELVDNTTPLLIEDFEKIRHQLGIEQWLLFGGSWGSTLALAYAQAHPTHISRLILRGIYLASDAENNWLFNGQGANRLFPDFWQAFESIIPVAERHDMIRAYHDRLTSPDEATRRQAAHAWSSWEISISKLIHNPDDVTAFLDSPAAISTARLECHYMINRCFFDNDQLINNIDKIAHIPGHILHGRYDSVCAAHSAWRLHQAWPQSTCQFIAEAGHSLADPALAKALFDTVEAHRCRGN